MHPGEEAEAISRQLLMASSAFYAQLIRVVNRIYPLVVDVKAFPT